MNHRRYLTVLTILASTIPMATCAEDVALAEFERLVLTEEFFSEGACFADIDGDGDNDVVSGPYWYAGPDFRVRHAYAPAQRFPIKSYSNHFFSYCHDFNSDGRPDILAVPMPGTPAHWFQNPGLEGVYWEKHEALNDVSNESPELTDITGDGRPELVCINGGSYGYAEPNWADPTKPWTFTAVTPNKGYGRFTHGMGIGDVNGDGRMDLLETNGWWEQTPTKGELFKFHRQRFARSGGAQMYAYDFDGDGDNDVVSTQNAHAFGLSWFEQRKEGAEISFHEHPILTGNPADNPYGLTISQMHAVALVDVDGDGLQDLVTGKRYYAHGGGDPGAHQLPVLYWFKTHRSADGVWFEPWPIDKRSGVGTQLVAGDVDGNGRPDIVVGNKLGTYVMLNRRRDVSEAEYSAARPQHRQVPADIAGTDLFAQHVRATEPLTPAEQVSTFVLPPGFEIQLVASEPDINKPMNLAFDARGRLWVSSSREYPFAAPKDREGKDSIKILEDTDGDGRADVVTTFADGLNIPIGLYPHRDGVICFSIPNIWFLRDTDGDGKADHREKLYGPLGYERDTHGMCNSFTRGLDGWLYACHGFNNQTTIAGTDGHQIHMASGNVFRIRLDGSRVEHFSRGQVNPFGMSFDRFGDLFTADCHTKPISLLLEGGQHGHFGGQHDGLGFVPNVMEHLHGSTAIAGIALGQSTAFPAIYRQSTFGGNVMTSRVNRNTLVYRGSSLRAQEESDFLYSNDPWFRPVDVKVGPDGALYVADFYNRIIGHYEVPLTHPGRDRLRGRIWKIVYRDANARRDEPPRTDMAPVPTRDLTESTLPQLLDELDSSLQTRSRLATEQIIERFGDKAIATVRRLSKSGSPTRRAHLLWILHRLGASDPELLDAAARAESSLVRVHAMRLIAESTDAASHEHLERGLKDPEPLVRRAAAIAARKHPSTKLIRDIFDGVLDSRSDPHLYYSMRLALHEHLKNDDWFRAVSQADMSAAAVAELADLCLALKTPAAGEFLARYVLRQPEIKPAKLRQYLTYSVGYVSAESVAALVELARTKFRADDKLQIQLLDAIRSGLERRGIGLPRSVHEWALGLSEKLLGELESTSTISWTFLPHPGAPDAGNPWVLSTSRNSSDGQKATRLWSSFPRGEQRTGIYRSQPFVLPALFEYYCAGHDGHPPNPPGGKNLVRVRDAKTQEVLFHGAPPRNDTAQLTRWKTEDHAGKKAFVELVDGDTDGAFAWLAVGRFSVDGLNPSDSPERRRLGAEIAERFELREIRDKLGRLLLASLDDRDTSAALADALAAQSSDPRLAGLAKVARIVGASRDVRYRCFESLVNGNAAVASEPLVEALAVATGPEQFLVAQELARNRDGGTLLLELLQKGTITARVLPYGSVGTQLEAVLSDEQKAVLDDLLNDLPDESVELNDLIVKRKSRYTEKPGSAQKGKEVFKKACSACHRVGDEGANFAPNLDGVGNRGLDRLLEDILAPNRNVDIAFRATTIITKQGDVHNGLKRPSDGAQLVLIDQQGKEIAIKKSVIAKESPSQASPMPANFGESISDADFFDLLSYLLSLR